LKLGLPPIGSKVRVFFELPQLIQDKDAGPVSVLVVPGFADFRNGPCRGPRGTVAYQEGLHMIGRMMLLALLATSTSASSSFAAETGGDPVAGRAIFQRTCQNCHAVEIGVNKVGPSLWNVVGRQPAAVPDFVYSDGMKANKTAWTVSSLDAYLADPRGDVHGVKMFFKGLPDPKDRTDVMAYLQTLK
jgi:cytochrome c